jgi:hypothetical protein
MSDTSDLDDAGRFREPYEGVADADSRHRWRIWLLALVLGLIACTAILYIAVVLIDPFSTGRFSLTQRIDFATRTMRLADAGLVRDRRFDAAILGDSTGFTLDPARISEASKWQVAQLAIPAATPANILTVASAFERHHRAVRTLEVFVLSGGWCRSNDPNASRFGPFPDWLYESSDRLYLSRIFFSDAVVSAAVRVGIWLDVADQAAPADGFAPAYRTRNNAEFLGERPTEAPPPEAPFPAIDALMAHIFALPTRAAVAFVLVPPYVSLLPVDGSIAAARMRVCKDRIRQIAAGRPGTSYLDLMTENSISREIENYQDPVHYNLTGAHQVESRIAHLIEQSGLSPN